MDRQAVGTQSLRSGPGNFFASQPASRNPPMTSQRLPNGKIGGGTSGWGTGGLPLGGTTPSFANPPSRTNTMPNFAQAIGGATSQSSLDMSEFPSLSGGPQSQGQNQMSQAWNSNALRQTQPAQQSVGSRVTSDQQRRAPSDTFGFNAGIEDAFEGRLTGLARPESTAAQPGAGEEFPPLGGAPNGEGRLDRLGAPGGGAFGVGQINGQIDGEPFGGANTEGIRSSLDQPGNPSAQLPFREGAFSSSRAGPMGQPSAAQSLQQGSDFAPQPPGSPQSAQQSTQPRRRLSEMNDSDKWGLQGLLAQLPGRSEGGGGIVMGQDLNTLGIDFDSADPLFPTFSTPFADANARPAIPEFRIPAAYTVSNVPPLHSRIGNFSDETLFAIFYQFTRDVLQEMAAAELYSRDWRWHKELRQWMMKDASMAQPLRITERSERGVYVFFDAMNWRRERREFILNYDHLDQRHAPSQPATAP